MMETKDWQSIKDEFNSIPSYEQKLLWWNLNVKPEKYSGHRYEVYYNTDDAPIEKRNTILMSIRNDNSFEPIMAKSETPDFITILPEHDSNEQKLLFWSWIKNKLMVQPFDEMELTILKTLENTHPANIDERIKMFEDEIQNEIAKYKNNNQFKSGHKFAITNNANLLFFGDSETKVHRMNDVIKFYVAGYQNRLKEMALIQVVEKFKNPEPIEQMPEQVSETAGQKIAILYELGLIDILVQMEMKPQQIGNLLQEITGENGDTCKNIYRAIMSSHKERNDPFNESNRAYLDRLYTRLKISPKVKGVPYSDKKDKVK